VKKSLYDTLGVDKNSSPEDIKKAYREKSKSAHPDRGGSNEEQANLNKAYTLLIDVEKRARYDQTGNDNEIPFENKFNQFITQVFMQLSGEMDIDHENLIDAIKSEMYKGVMNLEANIENNEKLKNKFERIQRRMKSKGNQSLLHLVAGQIEIFKNTIENCKVEIDFIKQCKAVMEEYSYEVDQRPQPHNQFMQFGGNNPFQTFRTF
jgi:DnaJ-class molecular chaperone